MTFKRKIIPALIISGSVFAASGNVYANDSDELEKLRALVQELDQKIRVIDRKNELAEEAAAAKKKETPVVKASKDGFGIESGDGNFKIKFGGLIQGDYRYFNNGRSAGGAAGGQAVDTAIARRAEPIIQATLFDKYDFVYVGEFGSNAGTNSNTIVDAFGRARFSPAFTVQAGRFQVPLSLGRLQGSNTIKFVERAYPTDALLPNRSQGFAVLGTVLDKKLDYSVGIYNTLIDGASENTTTDTNNDKEYAARLFARPFQGSDSALAGLGFGIAATYGEVRFADLPGTYKSSAQNTIFTNIGVNDGKRYRWAPQAHYFYGPFGVIGEYVKSSQEINTAIGAANRKTVEHDAWQIEASYLLTGENASLGAVTPKRDFDFDKGTWGAWEVVGRYTELNLDDDIFKNATNTAASAIYANPTSSVSSASTWTLGVNWYLNQNAKIALNYLDTSFDGGGGGTNATPIDREDERALLARFQVQF